MFVLEAESSAGYTFIILQINVSIQPMSPCMGVVVVVVGVRLWNGFDEDSRWGTFCVAGEPLPAMLLSEVMHRQDTHVRSHTVYTWSVRVGGRRATVLHKTGEWAARSGYARSYHVSSPLQTRSEGTSQLCSVHIAENIAVYHTLSDNR